MSPFVVAGPLVNALLIRSSQALARIAELLGEDPEPHRHDAAAVRTAMHDQLWDPHHERYYSRNLRRGELIREASILSFMPLLDPELRRRGWLPSSATCRRPASIPRRPTSTTSSLAST